MEKDHVCKKRALRLYPEPEDMDKLIYTCLLWRIVIYFSDRLACDRDKEESMDGHCGTWVSARRKKRGQYDHVLKSKGLSCKNI